MYKRKWFVLLILVAIASLSFAGFVAGQDNDCVLEAGMDPNECPPPGFDSWDDVLEQARGQTVNWYFWGGSDSINRFVDVVYGGVLQEEFGITLNRVPVADTGDAVNQVLSEAEAGIEGDDGTIDAIWINGVNFFTLKQADLLYGPWARNIPNSVLVDWDNPALNLDFGVPVDDMESPWAGFIFHFMYDTARISEDDLPRSYAELGEWIQENPGRFTYMAPGPGAFQGTRFVKQLMFELSGDHEQWLGDFDQELYDEWAPLAWETLNAWKPYLWRQGETYPATGSELNQLFANAEVDFSITQRMTGAAAYIADGEVPPTAGAFAFDNYMIGDYSYLAIPFNAPNKAAALVLIDLILRPDMQAAQIDPEEGAGFGLAIDANRLTEEQAAVIEQAFADLVGAAPPEELTAALVSDIAPEYQTAIEEDWEANVLRGGN